MMRSMDVIMVPINVMVVVVLFMVVVPSSMMLTMHLELVEFVW